MLAISWYIGSIMFFFLYDYLFTKIVMDEKYTINLKKIIVSNIMTIINIYMLSNNLGYFRPYIIHLYFVLSFKMMYKCSIVKTLLCVLYILFIVSISEMAFGIILILIFKVDRNLFISQWYNYIISNSIIYLISFYLFKIPIFNIMIKNILKWNKDNEKRNTIISFGLLLTIIIFILYNNFINILPTPLLLLTNLFCIAVFVFVIGFFKEKTNNNKIIYEYDQLLDYVKVYERLLEEKSKNQHEYKNQLIIIRDTPKKKDRNKYINNILNVENSEDDSEWLRKLKYIPQGGLKGLIYYKIQIMLKNNINVLLSVSEELKETKVWKNFDKNLSDISKIIGVYLDNAIEATSNINEKYITISVYLENNEIVFDITNTYSGEIDIIKIDKEGYSTKGEGKGYGLSLVKDIISKNDKLEQKRIINGNYYTQQLYIKK